MDSDIDFFQTGFNTNENKVNEGVKK